MSNVKEAPKAPWRAVHQGEAEFGLWAEFEFKGVTQRLRWIPPGRFLMGSPKSEPGRWIDEFPQHKVTLTQGFWMFETAVTQALWEAVMGNNPSYFKGPDKPVETVSWDDCQAFLEAINTRLPGLALTLPTEAQWEYACRAGTQTPYYFGDIITPEQVNYDARFPYRDKDVLPRFYREETVAVKSLPPNNLGLYEMHGNVWEWCQDYWSINDSAEARTDPTGPPNSRWGVVKGGSWYNTDRSVRAAVRQYCARDCRDDQIGFRCISR